MIVPQMQQKKPRRGLKRKGGSVQECLDNYYKVAGMQSTGMPTSRSPFIAVLDADDRFRMTRLLVR